MFASVGPWAVMMIAWFKINDKLKSRPPERKFPPTLLRKKLHASIWERKLLPKWDYDPQQNVFPKVTTMLARILQNKLWRLSQNLQQLNISNMSSSLACHRSGKIYRKLFVSLSLLLSLPFPFHLLWWWSYSYNSFCLSRVQYFPILLMRRYALPSIRFTDVMGT